jgi:peptidoglycan-N-acetylglucosamine deacetylase
MGTGKATRRAVLVTGGVALLAHYWGDHASSAASASAPHPAGSPAPHPAGSPPASPTAARPSGASQSGARQPGASPSGASPSAAGSSPGRPSAARRVHSAPAADPATSRRALPPNPAETSTPTSRSRPARARPQHGRRTRRGGVEVPMEHIREGRKRIALTIDDGPSPEYTPQVLRLLERYRVTATFSMVGLEAVAYPGLVREVAAAGHTIANHTWSHANLAYLSPALIADQGDRASGAIHTATGHVPSLFRAPYGAWSPAVLQYCARTGMTPLDWSVDPRDWSRPGISAIVRNIMGNTRTGSIILEHDGGGNRSQTVAALKIVLPRLLDAGYHFAVP